MSYDLGFFYFATPMSSKQIAERYIALCHRPLDAPDSLDSLIEPHEKIAAFADEMTSAYPPLSAASDEEDDLCPWSCDPDISEGHVIVSLRWSCSQQMAQKLTKMAWSHGLVVYNPQDGKAYPPPSVSDTEGGDR